METVGSLVDKLCVNELKIYHTTEQSKRTDVSEQFRDDCKKRLEILTLQSQDLAEELEDLIGGVLSGEKQLKRYKQMKMYKEK